MEDKAFLEMVVKALVDNPNDVQVDRKVDEMGVLLTLTINPADMGKVIGKEGATAKALRTILRVVGMKNNARVNLKINEPAGSEHVVTKRPTPEVPTVEQVMQEIKGL
ncbi:MAG: KH domain-containing protein [Minisyncoccia bacterium]